jgi:hypothetical protein
MGARRAQALLWPNPVIADLGLTSMARGRCCLRSRNSPDPHSGQPRTHSLAVRDAELSEPACDLDHRRACFRRMQIANAFGPNERLTQRHFVR